MHGPFPATVPWLLVLAMLAVPACRYQVRSPPQIDAAIAIEVVHSRARLVRAQSYLQHELAREIVSELGWRVSPAGRVRLQLLLAEEDIAEASADVRDVPNAWQVSVRGRAVLVLPGGGDAVQPYTFSGIGTLSSREREALGVRSAARQAAQRIVDWLENHAAEIAAATGTP